MVRADLWLRVVAAVLMIAPLAFFMGIPFPYGMSRIDPNSRLLAAFGWGVNGFFSVLGSIIVVILSMSYGFRVVFTIAAILYGLAMLVSKKLEVKTEA
jgi:MFS family permease